MTSAMSLVMTLTTCQSRYVMAESQSTAGRTRSWLDDGRGCNLIRRTWRARGDTPRSRDCTTACCWARGVGATVLPRGAVRGAATAARANPALRREAPLIFKAMPACSRVFALGAVSQFMRSNRDATIAG